jgi:hypothetical protein
MLAGVRGFLQPRERVPAALLGGCEVSTPGVYHLGVTLLVSTETRLLVFPFGLWTPPALTVLYAEIRALRVWTGAAGASLALESEEATIVVRWVAEGSPELFYGAMRQRVARHTLTSVDGWASTIKGPRGHVGAH